MENNDEEMEKKIGWTIFQVISPRKSWVYVRKYAKIRMENDSGSVNSSYLMPRTSSNISMYPHVVVFVQERT